MKRFSKPLNKVDLSSPVFFQWYQWFRGLNQTAQTRRHLALFYHLTSKRPRFRRSGRSENNTGSSEIWQNLNNWIKILYFIGAWNVLFGGHFKICGQREVWNQDLSLIPRVFSFSNEKTLGTRLKSLFASDFPKVFEFPTIPAPS